MSTFRPFALVTISLGLLGTVAYAGDLTVHIDGAASTEGTVRAALHDGAEGFPADRTPVQGMVTDADPGGVTLVFEDLAPGRYAIAAYHDEDGDEALTTNLFGIPKERFGFSQGARGTLGPPSFDAAAFDVGAEGAEVTVNLED